MFLLGENDRNSRYDFTAGGTWPGLHFLHGRFFVTDQSKRRCQMEVYVFTFIFYSSVSFNFLGSGLSLL